MPAGMFFSPLLVELPRFKGLDQGFIFHVATDRLTLHYCVDRLPLRLTSKCTHLSDLLWGSTNLLSCIVLINMNFSCFLSYVLEGILHFVSKSLTHIVFYYGYTFISQTHTFNFFHRNIRNRKVDY